MTLTYANGPGYRQHTNSDGRVNLTATGLDFANYEFTHPATVPMVSLIE